MPELPEVETIRRVLEPQLKGQKIVRIKVGNPAVIASPDAAAFERLLTGQRIASLSRRGKFLRIHLEDGSCLTLHLRMTGCLLVAPKALAPEKHTHLTFQLDGGLELRFSDPRRFGRFWLIPAGEDDVVSGTARLGLEPFDPALTAEYLRARLSASRRAIKACLLAQDIVAGIGNIYSDEILFTAQICPDTPAADLTADDWARLAAAIPERLQYFIEKNRICAADYLAGKGRDYRNTPFLQVYGRAGKPCPVCGTALKRSVIGGRSSVSCPHCQSASEPAIRTAPRLSTSQIPPESTPRVLRAPRSGNPA